MSDLGIQQKRVKIEIALEEKVENLRPEYDLDIKVIINNSKDVLVIPENAVFQQKNNNYVFVNEKGIAVLMEIETGVESERKIEVVRGLKEGEEVILLPDEELSEGVAISIQ